MTIKYTKHALKKFIDLKQLGVIVTKRRIRIIIQKPIHRDTHSDEPNIIATGKLDTQHILRIVYKTEHDIITVITFYPTKKGRYFS